MSQYNCGFHKFGIEGNLNLNLYLGSPITWIIGHKLQLWSLLNRMNWTWLAVSLKDRFWVQTCLVCTPMTCQRVWFLAFYTLYADVSTTSYSIGSTVNEACSLLNKALDELNNWCMANSLIPHSAKCEATLFYKGSFIGQYLVLAIGNETISWVCHERLLGITIDHKRTWTKHLTELKENFVNKLNLLRKCSFLTKKSLLDLYFKTILPSVTYGITLWGICNNCDPH